MNHILTNKSNLRVAAAVNDFAELNIDEDLVRSKGRASGVVELSNGCVCCSVLLDDLRDAVWNMLREGGDVSTDDVNYLVVETSGVSDPMSVVRALDTKFGKMYRARLDSVVTVVDTDDLLHFGAVCRGGGGGGGGGGTPALGAAAEAQLRCADVVILNKIDLLDDDEDGVKVEDAERIVRFYNPHATVHRAIRCDVPLSAVLDVETAPPDPDGSGRSAITHERSETPVYVSPEGGSLRSYSSGGGTGAEAQASLSVPGAPFRRHMREDGFSSVSVSESDEPVSLSRFSEFVTSSAVVGGLVRMKGVLWIRGLDPHRCVVHLSGRGRLGYEIDGPWSGPPRSDVAFIGQELNPAKIRAAFLACRVSDEDKEETGGGGKSARGMDVIRNSPMFEVLDSGGADPADGCDNLHPPISHFRLTGAKHFGYSVEEISQDLRIDIDAMNVDLADAVNASVDRPKGFLAYADLTGNEKRPGRAPQIQRGRIVLCYAGGEPAGNADVLTREALRVLTAHFRNVQSCRCGA